MRGFGVFVQLLVLCRFVASLLLQPVAVVAGCFCRCCRCVLLRVVVAAAAAVVIVVPPPPPNVQPKAFWHHIGWRAEWHGEWRAEWHDEWRAGWHDGWRAEWHFEWQPGAWQQPDAGQAQMEAAGADAQHDGLLEVVGMIEQMLPVTTLKRHQFGTFAPSRCRECGAHTYLGSGRCFNPGCKLHGGGSSGSSCKGRAINWSRMMCIWHQLCVAVHCACCKPGMLQARCDVPIVYALLCSAFCCAAGPFQCIVHCSESGSIVIHECDS